MNAKTTFKQTDMTNQNTLPAGAPYQRVDVDLGERRYPIHIGPGLLHQADGLLGDAIRDRHIVVIADRAVAGQHLPILTEALGRTAQKVDTITIDGGEASKSISCYGQVVEDVLALNIDRKVMLVAFGGGDWRSGGVCCRQPIARC